MHVNDLHDVPRWWKSAIEGGGDDDHRVRKTSNQESQPVVRATRMLEEQSQEMSRDIRSSCRFSKASEINR